MASHVVCLILFVLFALSVLSDLYLLCILAGVDFRFLFTLVTQSERLVKGRGDLHGRLQRKSSEIRRMVEAKFGKLMQNGKDWKGWAKATRTRHI